MRMLIAITQLSLDGIMGEIMAGEFDMLLGRRTDDIFSAYWPHQANGAIANAFNKATKYVVTRRRDPLEWGPSRRIGDDVVNEVRRLKALDGPEFHVWGSSVPPRRLSLVATQSTSTGVLINTYRPADPLPRG